MSFLVARNAVGVGVESLISLRGASLFGWIKGYLLTEAGDKLVQENGGLILLE